MTSPHVSIKLYDVRDAAGCLRAMNREARGLAGRYSALTAILFGLASDGGQYEAHLYLHFPQHQIIVNAAAPTSERAMQDALAKAAGELTRLEARDPSVARTAQAKAA